MTVAVITGYDHGMGRWEPDAQGRLASAAMELYLERGFEATTVAEIAERAGLTERTFFRHFADKREVLFAGGSALEALLVAKVGEAPPALAPIEAVTTALIEVADIAFAERHEFARQRQAIIARNPDLQERELIKLASLASATAGALRVRGVRDPAASLAAETGIAVFKIAFARWVRSPGERPLAPFIRQSMDELKLVAAG
jgi:AcrR family transcriptional regulator